jgi:hypothetical protein
MSQPSKTLPVLPVGMLRRPRRGRRGRHSTDSSRGPAQTTFAQHVGTSLLHKGNWTVKKNCPVSSDLVRVSLELAQSGRMSHLIWSVAAYQAL